ncbi:MAG: hypothetical protein QOH60_1047 [Mycobacterium sp.]|jgi:uncharacterized OB-fold protein|nr:hypothetical protein [Mycobacterium sp.]
MTLQPQSGHVPHGSNPVSAPFWAGCAEHELRYQNCGDCGQANFPPTEFCRYCLSGQLNWASSGGLGEIYSWTVVHRPVTAAFAAPYAPAIVTMSEGYRMLTNIVFTAERDLKVGLPVRVEFVAVNEELTLPYFTAQA